MKLFHRIAHRVHEEWVHLVVEFGHLAHMAHDVLAHTKVGVVAGAH